MNQLAYTNESDLAAVIRAGAIAERDLRNEIAGRADRAADLAAQAEHAGDYAGAHRLRNLEGATRSAAVTA